MGPIRTQDVTVVKQAILTQKYIMLHLLEIMIKNNNNNSNKKTNTNKKTRAKPELHMDNSTYYRYMAKLTPGVMGMSDSPFQ